MSFLLLVCAACLTTGCGTGRSTNQHEAAPFGNVINFIASADTSRGFQPHLPGAADLLLQVNQQLVPGRDRLSVYRTDWDTTEVYDDLVPQSTEALQDTLVPAFSATPKRDGTRPETFFAAATGAATGRSVILYCTDGDVDEPPAQAEAALRKAGTALAENKNIRRVVLVGVTRGNRALWRRCFAPLDASGRLSLLTLGPETPGRVSDLIAAAR